MKKVSVSSLLFFALLSYAQQDLVHQHQMSPQVHRCMKVMDDPKHMEEMVRYMFQKREAMKKIMENNPDIKKQMEELIK